MINSLFIWQIPRRSTGEGRKRYLTVANVSWKRTSHLKVPVRICLRAHYECIVCEWHACLRGRWKHVRLTVALASALQWMPDFIYYFDGQRKLPDDSHVLPELFVALTLILLHPFVVLLNYYMQGIWVLWPRSTDLMESGVRGVGDFVLACPALTVGTGRPWVSLLPLYSPSILSHSMRHLGSMTRAVPSRSDIPGSTFAICFNTSWAVCVIIWTWRPPDRASVWKVRARHTPNALDYMGIFLWGRLLRI